MKIELTSENAQFVIDSVDTHLKKRGITVLFPAAAVVASIQMGAKESAEGQNREGASDAAS